MEARVPARLSPADGRRFGFTVGAAFLLVSGLMWWRGRDVGAVVTLSVAAALLVAAITVPAHLGPVRSTWLRVGATLSSVTTPIFLSVVHFGVIAPIGALLRLTGRNPLKRYQRRETCWVLRPAAIRSRRDMERHF